MIRKWQWLALLGVVLLASQCSQGPQEPKELKTEKDKVSYGVGVTVGKNFKTQMMDINVDMVLKGLKDELTGKKLLLSDDEIRQTMITYQRELRVKQMQERKMAELEKKKEGDAFREEFKKKEGVVALPSGLLYKIIKAGDGPKPTPQDRVEVKYRGTFVNGKEFDSSGNEARTFNLAQTIPGWREALPLMPVGSKWQLVVPPELAYGERGMGLVILPNSTLVFDLELVSIKPPEAQPPGAQAPGAQAPAPAPGAVKPPAAQAPGAAKPPEGQPAAKPKK